MPGMTARGPTPNFGVDVSALSRGSGVSSCGGGSGSGGSGSGGSGGGVSGEGFEVEEEDRAPSSSPPIFGEHSIDAAATETFSGHAAGDDFMVKCDYNGSSPDGIGGGGSGGNRRRYNGAFSSPSAAAAAVAVSISPARLEGGRTVSPSKVPLTPMSLSGSSSASSGVPPGPQHPLPPPRRRQVASSTSSVYDNEDSVVGGYGGAGGGDVRVKEEGGGEEGGQLSPDASGEWDDDTSLPPEMEPLSRATEVSPAGQRRQGEVMDRGGAGATGAGAAAGGAAAGQGGDVGGGFQNGQRWVAAGSKTPPGGPKKLGGKDEYAFVAAGNE